MARNDCAQARRLGMSARSSSTMISKSSRGSLLDISVGWDVELRRDTRVVSTWLFSERCLMALITDGVEHPEKAGCDRDY